MKISGPTDNRDWTFMKAVDRLERKDFWSQVVPHTPRTNGSIMI